MRANINSKKIKKLLDRWVDKIYPSKRAFENILKSRKKLTIYHGVDPTSSHLHLGHSTNYLLLRKLQELGHYIILLIGDFTAQIGDPTGKSVVRKTLTKEQIFKNYKTYQEQVGKILDFKSKENPAQLKFNSEWWKSFKTEDLIRLTAQFTYGQVIKRNMFQQRLKKNKEIYLHEFLYPLFQGYDSVAMNVDVEVGGTDQTFNMLIGRQLMKNFRKKEKFVITTPLLINPKTKEKLMSKSKGGFVALDDFPNQMYGKIMALPDEVIIPCFELCTEESLDEIKKMKKELKAEIVNPKKVKIKLAREIVSLYYGKKAALEAEQEFERVFKEKKMPVKILEIKIKEKSLNILDLLVKTKLTSSRAEAKRLIIQKGVKIDNKIQQEWREKVKIKKGLVIQKGKRKFIRII